MAYRTDLAMERNGKTTQKENLRGFPVRRSKEGEVCYVTIEAPRIGGGDDEEASLRRLVTDELQKLLPQKGEILVAGLGNADMTPDALGPICADQVFATRHIKGTVAHEVGLGELRSVAVVKPGVLGTTGIETAELLRALVQKLHPAAVIAVDALAAGRLHRLCKTIQISTGGIAPGSGVRNDRPRLDEETIGAPVIGIGVPTVVDAATLCEDLCSGEVEGAGTMMVTPRGIDSLVSRAAGLLALAINCAINDSIDPETYEQLMLA